MQDGEILVKNSTGTNEPFDPAPPVYRTDDNPAYRGNPLIEGLPPVPTKAQAFIALTLRTAPRRSDFRSLPAADRLDLLSELQKVFVPTSQHIAAMQSIMALIRSCYEYRNPNNAEVQRCLYKAAQGMPIQLGRLSPTGGGSNGMVLWGVTGAGKTSFLDRLAMYLGTKPLYHRVVQGGQALWPQIPMLRVQCKQTLRGTSLALLQHLDQQLHSSHYSRVSDRFTIDQFVAKIQLAISIHFVGVVVIEDIHKLKDKPEDVLDFLCDLMEECGIPVVAVSTYKFREALFADPSVASKLTAKGVINFEPLKYAPPTCSGGESDDGDDTDTGNMDEDFQDWGRFIFELFQLNVFPHKVEMPDELPRWMHFHTLGVRRFAREMMTVAFERSLRDDRIANIDLPLLDSIAKGELLKYQEALDVLRKRLIHQHIDSALAERFEHLIPPQEGLAEIIERMKTRESSSDNARAAQNGNSRNASSATAAKSSGESRREKNESKAATKSSPKATISGTQTATGRTAAEVYQALHAQGKIAK